MDAGRRRLAGMMGLNYAVQGAWWPLLAVHLQDLGLSGRARGWIFATAALACLATPLFAGQLADRRIPTQRLLGLIYSLGAFLLAALAFGLVTEASLLFAVFLVYWLVTAPGYGLSSSVAFRNLPKPAEQFAGVRLWGTIGWMMSGWLVTAILWKTGAGASRDGLAGETAFGVSALLSAIFAVYCFRALPNTPPLDNGGGRRVSDLKQGLELFCRGETAAFLAIAFGVSLTMPFIYQTVPAYLGAVGLPRPWIASAMTLSQVPEILGLAVLPWFHRRFGLRAAMAIGISAWAIEFLVLSTQPVLGLALLVIPLNGIAIAGFMISGQMFLDSKAPSHRRASTQAIWILLISGLGSLLGNVLAGEVISRSQGLGPAVFLLPGLINCAALAALIGWFRPGLSGSGSVLAGRTATAALAGGKLDPRPPAG